MGIRRSEAGLLLGTLGRAQRLGQYAVYYNDPNLINTFGRKLDAVTKEQIQRVARTYFVETNRSVILTVPKAAATAGGTR
jgi:predicted Zn-dependent peptidase